MDLAATYRFKPMFNLFHTVLYQTVLFSIFHGNVRYFMAIFGIVWQYFRILWHMPTFGILWQYFGIL